jgi:two-component system phosphate regulon sensor histidine kinase PhoR
LKNVLLWRKCGTKIEKEFERVQLGKLKFEFAISDVEGNYEFYSPGYEQEFWDTINNKRNYYAILRDTDNLAFTEANEVLNYYCS